MRREISTIGVFSVAVSFVAAVVLCMQTAQFKVQPTFQLGNSTLWALEVGLFGVAVLIWRRTVSLSGWIVGIAALVAVRVALGAACAYGLAGFHGGPGYAHAVKLVANLLPRVSSAVFSLMVFYPLRGLLLDRVRVPRKPRAETANEDGLRVDEESIWLMRGDDKVRVQRNQDQAAGPATIITMASPEQFRGAIELPLRALLTQLPAEHLADGADHYGDSFPVSVPLALILPQLKEAQVMLTLEGLRKLLPPGVLSQTGARGYEGEPTTVSLALEEVVPRLPAEALELPPPSPPAWVELPDPESVVFATL